MVFVMLIVGGITRLTQSGLSITEWEPLWGLLPPLSESDWSRYFQAYQTSPEYQKLNRGMSLEEFQGIFWWEYVHRVVARLFGLGLVIPMAYFTIRGWLRGRDLIRAVALVILVAMQALLGWKMVQSGLADQPYISHHFLAGHLGLAILLFGAMQWWALRLLSDPRDRELPRRSSPQVSLLRRWAVIFTVLIFIQSLWGAFVAGLQAGRMSNTFPKMGEHWIPPSVGELSPLWIDLTSNPLTVQFIHRTLGISLVIVATLLWLLGRRGSAHNLGPISLLLAITIVQACLGIATLLLAVPVVLGVLHQAVALMLFGAALWVVHTLSYFDAPT